MAIDNAHNAWQTNDHDRTTSPVKDVAQQFKALDIEPVPFVHQDQVKVIASNSLNSDGFHIIDVVACMLTIEGNNQLLGESFGRRTWTDLDANTGRETSIGPWRER